MEENYQIRGQRVVKLTQEYIAENASMMCKLFNIRKSRKRPKMDVLIDQIEERSGIIVHIVDDNEWVVPAEAYSDPSELSVWLPENLYFKICDGCKDAIHIFFHELGHVFLAHRKVFHFTKADMPVKEEDAEWQADTFADTVVEIMGIEEPKQIQLDLWDKALGR